MKKKLSLLIVAFMALAAYAGLNAWRTASSEVVYTLEQVKNTSQNAYDTPYDMTSNGITWSVEANISTDDGIRIGGKSLDKVDKLIYSKNKLDKAVGKITINHYGVTSENMKVHSVTLTVASDADFSNVIETQTKTDMTIGKKADGTIDFEPASGEWAANSYYKFAVNVSNSSSSKNYAFVLKSIVFYGVASGGEGETGETKTVYLKPGVWNADGARFAAYLFKGEENTWVDFSSTPGADGSTGTYFKADIPVSYTTMILVRMKSGTTENNWDNDWNQTDDIDISELADNTLYRITSWGSGSNSPYDTTTWPEQSTDPDPQTEDDVYYAVGVDELWGWSKADANKLVKGDDGKYRITKENAMLPAGEYGYKIMKNDTYVPEGENNEKKLKIERSAYYNVTLTLDPTADPLVNGYEAVATIANRLNSIAEVQAADAGTDVAVEGVVYASAKNGAVLYDYQDYLFYYNTSNALTVGQKVVLTGKVGKYGGASQLTKDATIYNIGTVDEIVYPNPVTLTGAEFDAIKTAGVAERKYVTFNGKLTVSGNYYNVAVPGAESAVASIVKPSDDVYKSDLNGKDITVKGYLMYVNNQYVYVVATSIEEYVAPVTINSMSIVGELTGGWPNTETGDWSMAKEMTKSADNPNIWTLSVAEFEAEAKEYQYKATANGKYGDYELPSEGNKKYTFTEAGKYSLLFTADTEKHELTLVATKAEPDKQTFTATFKNSIGWADVYAYAWSGEGESVVEFNGSFPGVKLEKDETIGVYKYSVEAVNAPEKIIFSNGLTGEDLQQTEDLVFTNGAEYDKTASTEPATISKVQICGATDAAWTNRIDFELNSAAPEQPNTYYNVLDATAYTDDVEFKLVVNESEWLGIGRFEKIEDPEGLVDQTTNVGDGKSYNFILKNSNGKYQKYDFKASWKENPDAGAGWTLEVLGKEARAEQPGDATWTVAGDNATLFGETWKPALTANDMVKGEDGLYKWEKTEQTLTAGDVLFKVVKNHSWDNEAYPSDNYKLTIPENGKYTVTITFDAEKKEVAAVATKTGDVVIPDAEITSVQMPGDWNWALEKGEDNVEPYLVLTKGENNTWTGVLDLTEVTTDQKFKLVVNKKEWLGLGELTLNAGELVSTETDKDNNFILLNATSGYQTYDVTATWEANASAKAGWTLTIAGKDERPVVTEPVYTLVGAFYDGEGKESASFFGESWKVLEANNLEKIYDEFYKKEYTGINLEKGNVSLKVLKDGDWDHPYPNADGYLLEIPSAGVYDLTFTFHPDQSVVRGEADKKSDPIEITRMDIVGDFTGGWPSKDETSGEWDWSVAKAMTQDATNPAIWTLTVEDFKAEAKTYEYKATANGQYGVYELPASGNNNWVFGTEAYPAGKYDLLFTANTADNSLTVVPTLKEVETVILDEEETLAENQVLEVDEPFTSDEITVEDGQIITIEADEAGESLVPRRAFRALAASDITIQYKPEAGSDWQDAPVTVETNETGYQFEVTGAVATAINDRGFAIKANKPIVVTQVAVVTEVTPDPEPEPVYYAVGVKALWGVNDWTVDDANKLTLNGEGKYTITKTELTLDANTNYGYKVVKKVGDTQYWIPDGMDNEKNLTVTERAVYSVTLTLDPAEPLTAESFNAVATKTGEAEPAADAEITKVEIRGSFNGWDTPADGLVMTKQGETNTYTATLDLTEITEDVQFKLVLNNMVDWLGWGELELVAPENWTEKANDGNNIVLKNASTGYKTYTLTATWTPGPVAKTGWKLEIAGKDERPAVPATITKVELRGEFTSWSDGEGVELTKQGETDTYAGVLDLSEITADQAFKLVINDKTYWIDFNHIELSAPEGWLSKEAGDASEPAIILANATTGYKTYDVTATWTPSTDASAGWKLEIAGKDARETTPEPEANYYIVGSMTDWTVKAEDTYKLTLNENAEAGVTEYMKTIDFAAGAEFKVVKVQGETQTWYPDGMDNNYVITNASNYTVYFRPNGDGGEGWHYGYIYAVDNNPAGINALKVAIQKGAEVYTINGQRVQNPTKGLYIVNGRKVVIK